MHSAGKIRITARKKRNGCIVSAWVSDQTLKDLDALCQKSGITRSHLIGYLVEVGVSSLKDADSAGVLDVIKLCRSMQDGLAAWVESLTDSKAIVQKMYNRKA